MSIYALGALLVAIAVLAAFAKRLLEIRQEHDRLWNHLDESGIERALRLLLRRGYHQASGLLVDLQSGLFLEFRKYISEAGSVGLSMRFPRSPHSERHYQGVQDVLTRAGLPYERIAIDRPPAVEVISADFGKNVELACDVASRIFLDVYGFSRITVAFRAEEICVRDEEVTRRDHPRLLESASRRRQR